MPESLLEHMRGLAKQRINSAWSIEAVKQGVAHAKNGKWVTAADTACNGTN